MRIHTGCDWFDILGEKGSSSSAPDRVLLRFSHSPCLLEPQRRKQCGNQEKEKKKKRKPRKKKKKKDLGAEQALSFVLTESELEETDGASAHGLGGKNHEEEGNAETKKGEKKEEKHRKKKKKPLCGTGTRMAL